MISAERQSRRNRYSTANIRTAAITSDCSSEGQRPFDEVRGPVQHRIDRDTLRLQGRRQLRQRGFDGMRRLQRVGAITGWPATAARRAAP